MENSYLIKGGKSLRGEVVLSGAKNVALKTIIASLLFNNKVILENVPRIEDVYELLYLIKVLGGTAEFIDKNKVAVDSSKINSNRLDFFHASKIRVSFMFFAPLLYRFQACYIPNPGGCRIGARPIDRIIKGMENLGVTVEYDSSTGYYYAKMNKAPTGTYIFPKSSHTGTEMLIMLAVYTKDQVVIENAAQEPEIDELIKFFNESGANVVREGNRITVTAGGELKQIKPFRIVSDRNEAVTFAAMGLATQGEVTISHISEYHIKSFLNKIHDAGVNVDYIKGDKWKFTCKNEIRATNVDTSPHPGFMTDWQPPWAVLMTQAMGDSIIHERVFENRFAYVEELKKLGAKIEYLDMTIENPKDYYYFNYDYLKKYNQIIRVTGPQKLHNGILTVTDLRAGATLVIAALISQGESVVNNASIIDRGYEDFVEKIQKLGGDIRKT